MERRPRIVFFFCPLHHRSYILWRRTTWRFFIPFVSNDIFHSGACTCITCVWFENRQVDPAEIARIGWHSFCRIQCGIEWCWSLGRTWVQNIIYYIYACVCVLYLRNLSANLANGYMTNLAAIELAPHNLVQRKPPKITTKTQTEFNYNMTHIKILFGSDKIIWYNTIILYL